MLCGFCAPVCCVSNNKAPLEMKGGTLERSKDVLAQNHDRGPRVEALGIYSHFLSNVGKLKRGERGQLCAW